MLMAAVLAVFAQASWAGRDSPADFPSAPNAARSAGEYIYPIALPPVGGSTFSARALDGICPGGVVSVEPLGYFRGLRLGRVRTRGRCKGEQLAGATSGSSDPAVDDILPALLNPDQAQLWLDEDPPVRSATVYTLPTHAWRIGITADGVYRITYDAMNAAGVPLSGATPADFHLLSMGQEVALQEIGMEDGSIDPGDAFAFYGRKFHGSVQDEKYTDENVYWLTVDSSSPGLRMATVDVTPSGTGAPVQSYDATSRTEEDNVYWARWSDHPGTQDTWFWERAIAAGHDVTRTYPITISDMAGSSGYCVFRAEVAARNYNDAVSPDHHIRWSLNGVPVGEDRWDGKVGLEVLHPFSCTLLHDGVNTIGMALLTDAGTQDVYFDWGEVSYPRRLEAESGALEFRAPLSGLGAYTVTGFSKAPTYLYMALDPRRPAVLSGAKVSASEEGYAVSFEISVHGGLLFVLSETASDVVLEPYSPPENLLHPATGADEIIVAPSAFYTATFPLADLHRSEGLRVKVARVEDLYALFNGGVFHPKAIRDFVAYAYAHWPGPPPSYLLLVGDGHFNFKGHNPSVYGQPGPEYIPPYLDFADPFQGEVAVDTMYASVVGDDDFPDLFVGRVPADSVEEVEEFVDKLRAYSEGVAGSWQKRVILAADNVPDKAGDFRGVVEDLADEYLGHMEVTKVYLNDYCGPPNSQPRTCAITATKALTQAWSAGASLLTYAGHASVHRWAHEPLLLNTQIPTIKPSPGLPWVISLDCLDGYFMLPPNYPGIPSTRSMAEVAVMLPRRGAIAYFAPSGLGDTDDEAAIADAIYSGIFRHHIVRLGPLTTLGRLASGTHLLRTYTLFGDPATVLHVQTFDLYLPLFRKQGKLLVRCLAEGAAHCAPSAR